MYQQSTLLKKTPPTAKNGYVHSNKNMESTIDLFYKNKIIGIQALKYQNIGFQVIIGRHAPLFIIDNQQNLFCFSLPPLETTLIQF